MSDGNGQDQVRDHVVRPEPAPPVAVPEPDVVPVSGRRHAPPVRIGAIWVGLCALVIVAIAFIVFLVQNTGRVHVTFVSLHASLPLAVALLIAALAGAFVTLWIGTIRITRRRRMARRDAGK